MGYTLFDNAVLSDIPEVEDYLDQELPEEPDFSKDEASLESFAAVTATEIKDDKIVDCCPKPEGAGGPMIQYTIVPNKSGKGRMITFYLNVTAFTDYIVNQFILISDILIKPEDVLFIHLPSILDAPYAPVIYNTIQACKAKAKIGCNPYVLNTAAFYPLLACDFIMPCKFGIACFNAMSLMAGGAGHIDAKNAMKFDEERKLKLLQAAASAGFVPENQLKHILEEQGSYAIYGTEFFDAIIRYNRAHRIIKPQPVAISEVKPAEQVISQNETA